MLIGEATADASGVISFSVSRDYTPANIILVGSNNNAISNESAGALRVNVTSQGNTVLNITRPLTGFISALLSQKNYGVRNLQELVMANDELPQVYLIANGQAGRESTINIEGTTDADLLVKFYTNPRGKWTLGVGIKESTVLANSSLLFDCTQNGVLFVDRVQIETAITAGAVLIVTDQRGFKTTISSLGELAAFETFTSSVLTNSDAAQAVVFSPFANFANFTKSVYIDNQTTQQIDLVSAPIEPVIL